MNKNCSKTLYVSVPPAQRSRYVAKWVLDDFFHHQPFKRRTCCHVEFNRPSLFILAPEARLVSTRKVRSHQISSICYLLLLTTPHSDSHRSAVTSFILLRKSCSMKELKYVRIAFLVGSVCSPATAMKIFGAEKPKMAS